MPFDKSLLRPCPNLCPTPQEFDDPIAYLSRPDILELGKKYGLVKVTPPLSWKPPFSIANLFTFHTRTQKLSDLGITSRSRKFFIDNLNRFLRMKKLAPVSPWVYAPGCRVHLYDLYLAVGKFALPLNELSGIQKMSLNKQFGLPADSNVLFDAYESSISVYAQFLASNGDNFDFPEGSPDDSDSCVICKKNHSPTTTLLCDNCDDLFHMRCLQPPLETVPEGAWYCEKCLVGTGEYGFEEHPELRYTLYEFLNHCRQFEHEFIRMHGGQPLSLDRIEEIFWSLIEQENSQTQVKYGADIHNTTPGEITGFPTAEFSPANLMVSEVYTKHAWNLTRLPFAKGSLLNHIESEISGMTVPWIYVGSLLSTFCWHVEDHYTLSANYCHLGSTKKWYGIPSSHASQFEAHMKSLAPDLFQRQPDLLHQLVTLISPSKLVEIGIPCFYADQNPNEFVVTYPRVYHAGFNSGFNFNEAVNFTMDSWIDHGEQSIKDYKIIKKENVFDHYNLLENILMCYLKDGRDLWSLRKDLIGKCIRSFESFLFSQRRYAHELMSDRLDTVVAPKKEPSMESRTRSVTRMGMSKPNEDDDNLCDICRVAISYQYCNINNRAHRFGKWYTGRRRIRPLVMDVDKLITPEASPCSTEVKEEDGAESSVLALQMAQSESAEVLEKLQGQARTTSSDEFDELIKQAKRKLETEERELEEHKAKRRHSRRLQVKTEPATMSPAASPGKVEKAPTKMSQMKKVQYSSLLSQLNQYDNIKLCLECTSLMCGERGEKIPRGSQMVFKKEFTAMEQVLSDSKLMYLAA